MLLLLVALLAIVAASIAGVPAGGDDRGAFALDTGLVEGVRQGGDYYVVATGLVRGGEVPERLATGVPLPTLTAIIATLPPRLAPLLLATLAMAVALAWFARLWTALSRPAARLAAAALLLLGAGFAFRSGAVPITESWAGLLVALSLARWRPARPTEAIGWALAAALIDVRAALVIVVLALFAMVAGARREAAGWALALIVLVAVLTVHRHTVELAGIVFADTDPAAAGIAGVLAALAAATTLAMVPVAIAAMLVALGIAGWSAWRDPLAPRVLAVTLAFLAIGAVSATGSDAALFAAPLSLLGLVFLPDGLRDLVRAALDKRRIVVRRMPR